MLNHPLSCLPKPSNDQKCQTQGSHIGLSFTTCCVTPATRQKTDRMKCQMNICCFQTKACLEEARKISAEMQFGNLGLELLNCSWEKQKQWICFFESRERGFSFTSMLQLWRAKYSHKSGIGEHCHLFLFIAFSKLTWFVDSGRHRHQLSVWWVYSGPAMI